MPNSKRRNDCISPLDKSKKKRIDEVISNEISIDKWIPNHDNLINMSKKAKNGDFSEVLFLIDLNYTKNSKNDLVTPQFLCPILGSSYYIGVSLFLSALKYRNEYIIKYLIDNGVYSIASNTMNSLRCHLETYLSLHLPHNKDNLPPSSYKTIREIVLSYTYRKKKDKNSVLSGGDAIDLKFILMQYCAQHKTIDYEIITYMLDLVNGSRVDITVDNLSHQYNTKTHLDTDIGTGNVVYFNTDSETNTNTNTNTNINTNTNTNANINTNTIININSNTNTKYAQNNVKCCTGTDTNILNNNTALLVSYCKNPYCNSATMKFLLNKGVDLDAIHTDASFNKNTPLMMFIESKNSSDTWTHSTESGKNKIPEKNKNPDREIIEEFVKAGSQLNIRNINGHSPLDLYLQKKQDFDLDILHLLFTIPLSSLPVINTGIHSDQVLGSDGVDNLLKTLLKYLLYSCDVNITVVDMLYSIILSISSDTNKLNSISINTSTNTNTNSLHNTNDVTVSNGINNTYINLCLATYVQNPHCIKSILIYLLDKGANINTVIDQNNTFVGVNSTDGIIFNENYQKDIKPPKSSKKSKKSQIQKKMYFSVFMLYCMNISCNYDIMTFLLENRPITDISFDIVENSGHKNGLNQTGQFYTQVILDYCENQTFICEPIDKESDIESESDSDSESESESESESNIIESGDEKDNQNASQNANQNVRQNTSVKCNTKDIKTKDIETKDIQPHIKDIRVVQLLIKLGGNILITDSNNWSPILRYLVKNKNSCDLPFLRGLVEISYDLAKSSVIPSQMLSVYCWFDNVNYDKVKGLNMDNTDLFEYSQQILKKIDKSKKTTKNVKFSENLGEGGDDEHENQNQNEDEDEDGEICDISKCDEIECCWSCRPLQCHFWRSKHNISTTSTNDYTDKCSLYTNTNSSSNDPYVKTRNAYHCLNDNYDIEYDEVFPYQDNCKVEVIHYIQSLFKQSPLNLSNNTGTTGSSIGNNVVSSCNLSDAISPTPSSSSSLSSLPSLSYFSPHKQFTCLKFVKFVHPLLLYGQYPECNPDILQLL